MYINIIRLCTQFEKKIFIRKIVIAILKHGNIDFFRRGCGPNIQNTITTQMLNRMIQYLIFSISVSFLTIL